jgi:hypothetical protein
MSDPQIDASGINDQGSADDQEPNQQDTVAYKTYQKVLSERKRDAERVREKDAIIAEFQAKEKQRIQDELIAKEEWKQLLDVTQSELKETREKLSSFERDRIDGLKLHVFMETLGGSIPTKYLDKVPLDKMVYDHETGELDMSSVQKAQMFVKREYPEIIQIASGPKVSPVAPTSAKVDDKNAMFERFARSLNK